MTQTSKYFFVTLNASKWNNRNIQVSGSHPKCNDTNIPVFHCHPKWNNINIEIFFTVILNGTPQTLGLK